MVSRFVGCLPAGDWWLVLVVCGVGGLVWVGSAGAEGLSCANEQLRAEQPYGLRLPDCRAYEMVSPLNKNDNGVSFSDSRASVSDESPAVTYFSAGSFAGTGSEPRGESIVSRYVSRRGSGGWSTEDITPPDDTFVPQTTTPFQELLFSPELSQGVLEERFTPLVSGEPGGYMNLFLADTKDGSYQRVSDITPPRTEVGPYEAGIADDPERPQAAGASTDLSDVVFQQNASLVEGASPDRERIYEW
jgi:hypothetical protein